MVPTILGSKINVVLKYMLGCGNNVYADFLRFRRTLAKGLALNYHSRSE
ncbi:hypothetical protein ALCH109712_06640 [Alkalicoccus chagannorensis]